MRVLTVVHDLGPGGTQRVAQNLATGYLDRGHASAVLALRGGPRVDALRERGVRVFVGGEESVDDPLARVVAWLPDVVHVHRVGTPDALLAAVLRRLRLASGPPAVLETNVFGKVDYSSDRFLIDVHMPLSRWSFWKWSRWSAGLRPAPIGVVSPNLVDTSTFGPVPEAMSAAWRAEQQLPPDAFVFGRVGQPQRAKWSPIVFDAFRELLARQPSAFLLLVGVPPELAQHRDRLPSAVRERIRELPFIAADSDLAACYGAMDAFLHAADIGESFGLVLVEAMLAERPVITLSTPTKDNSQLEVVGHGRGGLVVVDRRSMVEAMERLMLDQPLRERLGRDGAESARRRYDLAQNMAHFERIAELVLRAESREQLRAELEADPELITRVSDAEIDELLDSTIGRTSLRSRALLRLVHIGPLYRLYSRSLFRLKTR